jgi:hypothetical protein
MEESCNTHVQCPIDCAGEWDEWSPCSVPCGGGNQTRTYAVVFEAQHGGDCNDRDVVETRECNAQTCPPPPPDPVDCVGEWAAFGECSHMCTPGGTRQRTFVVSTAATHGGATCAEAAGAVNVQACHEDIPCRVDCEGVWLDWGICTALCGGGTQTRQFQVTVAAANGGTCAEQGTVQSQACNAEPCPIDCDGAWNTWSDCSEPCGGGTQTRGYNVLTPAQFGGICTHDGVTQTQDCNPDDCIPSGEHVGLQITDGLTIDGDVVYDLPLSTTGVLITLSRVLDGTAFEVGRSYDGLAWEGVMPTPLNFDCTATSTCTVTPPIVTDGDIYRFNVIQVEGRTDEKSLAAFLLQATFGPTRASVAEILAMGTDVSSSIAAWIDHQLEMPATLHRAYWRQNTNAPRNVQTRLGGPSHPCGSNTVWHRFAFSLSDGGKTLDVEPLAGGGYSLSIDGVVRTEIAAPEFLADAESGNFESVAPPYIICEVVQRDGLAGKVSIGNSSSCAHNTRRVVRPGFSYNWQSGAWGPITLANPPITFGTEPAGCLTLGPNDATFVDAVDPGVTVMQSLEIDCPLTSVGPEDISFMHYDGEYYRHEPVTQLLENSLESPLASPPSSFSAHPRERKSNFMTCSSAPKTFLNRDTCVRRPDCVTPLEYSDTTFVLTEDTIRAMYSSSGNRHVHAIDNLPFQPGQRSGYNPFDPELSGTQRVSGTRMVSPCSGSSRWKKLSSGCDADTETALDADTLASIRAAIDASADANPTVKDLGTIDGTCGDDVIEARVAVGDECWQHTHPSNLNVYDWTSWVLENGALPAAADSFLDNPIGKAARMGGAILSGADDDISWSAFATCLSGQYKSSSIDWEARDRQSSSHRPGMMNGDMYDQLSSNAYLLGRLGDEVSFADLRVELQSEELAALVGATVVGGGEWDGSEACGSPGEVANDATKGHNYGNFAISVFNGKGATIYSHQRGLRSTITSGFTFTASAVFENVAIKAEDQLRQRVAWGLAQLHVLSAVGFSGSPMAEAEMWITYHDILVRHAFGNLRDALREISYSPMMGRYLTFINSASYLNSGKHADENYAREVSHAINPSVCPPSELHATNPRLLRFILARSSWSYSLLAPTSATLTAPPS